MKESYPQNPALAIRVIAGRDGLHSESGKTSFFWGPGQRPTHHADLHCPQITPQPRYIFVLRRMPLFN